jgi:mannosyltransferase OCH1-like enzyme
MIKLGLILIINFCSTYAFIDFNVSMQAASYPQVLKNKDSEIIFRFLKDLYEKNRPDLMIKQQTPKIPKIIHQIWFGGKLPAEYVPYRESWIANHPDWIFIFWTDNPENYDRGILLHDFQALKESLQSPCNDRFIVIDVKNLQFENRTFFDRAINYGEKSDILKWEVVYRFGGVYVDTDFECLKPLDELHHIYNFYTGIQPLDTNVVQLGAALYGAVANHPILHACVNNIKNNQHIPQIVVKTGPIHFTQCFLTSVNQGNVIDIALPASYLYPCGYELRGSASNMWQQPESYAVHHWAGSWLKPEAFVTYKKK